MYFYGCSPRRLHFYIVLTTELVFNKLNHPSSDVSITMWKSLVTKEAGKRKTLHQTEYKKDIIKARDKKKCLILETVVCVVLRSFLLGLS